MIETIIFDIGGVLVHPTATPLSDKWARRCGLSSAEFDEIVFNSPHYHDAAIGKISNEVLWKGKIEQLGLSAEDAAVLRDDYDRAHNVQAALDLGMSSFQFTTTPDTIAHIQQLLNLSA